MLNFLCLNNKIMLLKSIVSVLVVMPVYYSSFDEIFLEYQYDIFLVSFLLYLNFSVQILRNFPGIDVDMILGAVAEHLKFTQKESRSVCCFLINVACYI